MSDDSRAGTRRLGRRSGAELGETLFVEAGAGSGKTKSLIEQDAVALIDEGDRDGEHRRNHVHREGGGRTTPTASAEIRPGAALGVRSVEHGPSTVARRSATAPRSINSTGRRSRPCTASPYAFSHSTRSRPNCRRGWRSARCRTSRTAGRKSATTCWTILTHREIGGDLQGNSVSMHIRSFAGKSRRSLEDQLGLGGGQSPR